MDTHDSNETPNKSYFGIGKEIYSRLGLKRKKELFLVLVLSLFSSLAESISITLIIPFISFFINPDTYLFHNIYENIFNFFNATSKQDIRRIITFVFIGTVILSGYVKFKHTKMSNQLAEDVTSDLRITIFNFLLSRNFSYFFSSKTNILMSSLTQKSASFTTYIFASVHIFNSFLVTSGIFTILIINEPFYTPIIIFSILSFFLIIFKIKAVSVRKIGRNIDANQNVLVNIFDNAVGYLPEIIIYNLQNFFASTLNTASKALGSNASTLRTTSLTPRIFLESFVMTFVVLLIYFSNFTERSVETNISYLAILALATAKCLPLINAVYINSINIQGSKPIIYNILKMLQAQKNFVNFETSYKPLKFDELIQIENLSFRYKENLPYVLKDISLEIKKGQKILIKGKTGSGKSTLINILSGLLIPSEGKILVDNTEVGLLNKNSWQKNIAIVPQTVFLNEASILENIAIGLDITKINFEKAKDAATKARVANFIETLPDKYNEKVGERGIRLSGGQRQRIGIARALYRNASLIILDEPTNALDLSTEDLVMKSINTLGKDITVIMISHSNSSLKLFDKSIDLDKLRQI